MIAEVGRILDVAARQSNACRDVADQLSYLHGELEAGHIPAYDVFSALTVLRTGNRFLMPSCCVLLQATILASLFGCFHAACCSHAGASEA